MFIEGFVMTALSKELKATGLEPAHNIALNAREVEELKYEAMRIIGKLADCKAWTGVREIGMLVIEVLPENKQFEMARHAIKHITTERAMSEIATVAMSLLNPEIRQVVLNGVAEKEPVAQAW